MRELQDFVQPMPTIENTFDSDPILGDFIKFYAPKDQYETIKNDLHNFGQRCADDILEMANHCETNPPYLKQFDAWGKRIDEIVVDPNWKKLDEVSSEEGLIAHGYRREFGEFSRVFQFAKLYLFHPSSAFYSCPLAMTDGAAKLIEQSGDEELKQNAFKHIIDMNPNNFWTSGQWMTEKTGGSDVSNTSTMARKVGDRYELDGIKWFTSATTSQMAFALARIEDINGKVTQGSRGLSLFYIELRDKQGKLNNIEILKLKDKLGTKALPTAELRLKGTPAKLVGEVGNGVKTISSLFNVTRIYNAISSCGAFRRLLDLSIDYSQKRIAFNKNLINHPLHVATICELEVEFAKCFHLTFFVTQLLGKEETTHTPETISQSLRLLTPVTKLFTAKKNMLASTELIESFGGNGYIEETGLPRFLRDNQVLCIWEGTTNVLSLDLLRAIHNDKAIGPYLHLIQEKIATLSDEHKKKALAELKILTNFLESIKEMDSEHQSTIARDLAFSIAQLTSGILIFEFSKKSPSTYSKFVADEIMKQQWCLFRETSEQLRSLQRKILNRN